MSNIKKYIKPAIFFSVSLVAYLAVMSVFHYFGVMKLASVGTVNFVVMAIILFLGGIYMGKKTSKKGYLEGLKLGGVVVVLSFASNIILVRHFDLYVVLYYFVLAVAATIGSMIGINLRH